MAVSLLLPFETMRISFIGGVIFWGALGVINDFISLYKKIWDTLIGKASILIIYALLTNFSLALSSQVINSIIQVEPGKLIYSVSFLSILTIPLLIFSISSVFLGIFIIFWQFYFFAMLFLKDLRKEPALAPLFSEEKKEYVMLTLFVRGLYILIALSFLYGLFQSFGKSYDKFVTEKTKSFIYNFEAYSKSRCIIARDEKAIHLNDKEIVIVKKVDDSYSFTLKACKPIISPNKSLKQDK